MDDELRNEQIVSRVPYYLFRILPFFVFLLTGISLWGQPEDELLYSFSVSEHCLSEYCISLINIELGNTGKVDIPIVTVKLRSAALKDTLLNPTVRRFGKLPMPFKTTTHDNLTELRFGPVERGKNIIVSFSTQSPSPTPILEHDAIAEIVAGTSAVVRGDPNGTRFGRVLTGIAELF